MSVRQINMASDEKKYLEALLKPFLKNHGFKKTSTTWRKPVDNFIQIISIQGSPYQKTFQIYIGVYICDLGDKKNPSEADSNIRITLNTYAKETEISKLLDFEKWEIDELPREEILEILEQYGLNWLNKCSTFDGAKAEYTLPSRIMAGWQRKQLDEYFA